MKEFQNLIKLLHLSAIPPIEYKILKLIKNQIILNNPIK